MGFVNNIFGSITEARGIEGQADLKRIQCEEQRDADHLQEYTTEREARQNAELAGLQMRQSRSAQTAAAGQTRTARAAAGFDMTSGSGGAAEQAVSASFDDQIANMALSSSIQQANAINAATTARHSGNVAQLSANLTADNMDAQAKAMRNSAWFSAAGGLVGAVSGGIDSYNKGGDWRQITASSMSGANTFSSVANAFNPYTSQHTSQGWDKNFIGNFLSHTT